MTEKKEARLEMRVSSNGNYMHFEETIDGYGVYILMGLAKLIVCVADAAGVPEADLLPFLTKLCGELRDTERTGGVTVDMGTIQRTLEKQEADNNG